jgi:hypothetical protein
MYDDTYGMGAAGKVDRFIALIEGPALAAR